MIDQDLLAILACPETQQDLVLADAALIEKINQRVQEGRLTTRAQAPVTDPIDGGLIRRDRKYLYPIQDGIPILLIDEAIAIGADFLS